MDVIVSRWLALGLVILTAWPAVGRAEPEPKRRFFIVDSYHPEYSWSQNVAKGLCAGMRQYGYLETDAEVTQCLTMQGVESSRAVIQWAWMDTKRRSDKDQMLEATVAINAAIKEFKPDLLFLGDDNAANYVGKLFLDTELPVVFWGVNNTPLKYGLVDALDKPGHNVTGAVEMGYYDETIALLKALVPAAKTFAILSDGSETGRSHYKAIEALAQEGRLPLQLVEVVSTERFTLWKQRVLELQETVDAFMIAQYNALKDDQGGAVSGEEAAGWYLANSRKPEAAVNAHFVDQGMLCTANDPARDQGFDVVTIAHDILANGKNPAIYPPIIREQGLRIVNAARARQLGITIPADAGVQKLVEDTVSSAR